MSQQTEDKAANLPNPAEMAQTYAEVAQRASRILTQFMEKKAKEGVDAPSDELGVAKAFMDLSAHLLANPVKLAQTQMNMMWDYFSLWQSSMMKMVGMPVSGPVAAPKKGDNRFRDEDWEQHFLFDFIKQSYLITARHLHDTVSGAEGLDEHTQQKVNFFTRQYIDALSPSNFAMTNPEVFRETVKSHGQNLIKGFNNLLHDVEQGDGQLRIRMTDTSAFEMGKNVATTPGKVIFQNELFQLIQYDPTTKDQYKKPFLIVPPWINKYYILDLREKNSLVKWATDQGHTTFIMSWVNPDEKLAQKSFENYLLQGSVEALNQVCAHTGEDSVNMAGYCLGGTLLMTTLAYLTGKKDKRVNSATFFTTMLNFSEPGELGVFLDENAVAGLEKKMNERGYLEGTEMAGTFNMLRANDLIWSFVVNNYLMGKDPFPFDLLYWNSDSTRMPAAMHSFYLRNMYLENKLKDPGGITLDGVKIDLTKVKTPCYFISTIEDHIAPWKSTYMGACLPSGKTKFVLGGSGHIAGIVNPPVANKYGYWVNDASDGNLPESPDDFLAGATQNAGSWWTHWHAWVTGLPGGSAQVPARVPGKGKLKVIEEAPGSYVKFRLDSQKKAK
ncbi:MAG TPA: class I poly(R)-hydroxyalkanoic acid synthase [Rhodocyclaceae bacterium]|jgi:polyhydroxyalkanoate synthase|nr:class I poly(R)-hydroxyalkanoic acid synthase [Rhodocyclaceae bacterium]HMV19661.1 class I poly(R)-hydroxyalkanoic acid synthase [Rhodocyclaceae bacterium]HMW76351.1 class I poly(R)-hydroxyalkanoic acid synthase [Rhodocyclaceae bacterium]HNL21070.1 class I poly(R)-hydroxyalkanoic acid synthase [Rhodocyclaceae bacterium]HNM20878.1 class I poly(R)-hydroxyalkanoic acid synthase [Rhodocyclaceae bacterium]